MDTAKVIEVIKTTLVRRGNGNDEPVRIITQYWSKEGKLLAEVDPCKRYTEKELRAFYFFVAGNYRLSAVSPFEDIIKLWEKSKDYL